MRIEKENCTGLIIDLQERLVPTIAGKDTVIRNSAKLIKGLKIFNVPLIFTQQNTRALGPTVKVLNDLVPKVDPIEKMCFSCFEASKVNELLQNNRKKYVIIAGVETHICVLQTALDLLANNFIPVVVEDCTGSSKENDKHVAMLRLQQEGAMLTTSGSLLYELCREAGNDDFRELLKLVKESNNA